MGNTEMTKYMAAGAFADITADKSVVRQLRRPGSRASRPRRRYDGKTYGVPYYAGSRVVTYRTDLFKKAGITKLPATTAAVRGRRARSCCAKNGKKGFSPVYIAGTDWYFAMGFVFDYGGGSRRRSAASGRACSSSPQSIAGLTAFKNFFHATSRASKTTDETHPNPYDVYSQGQAASIVGPGWFSCCVGPKSKGSTAQFVMPSHVKGKAMPGLPRRLRPRESRRRARTRRWRPTGSRTSPAPPREKALQAKGNIPNATNLLGSSVNERARVTQLVRPDGEALGRRRERERPPQHAGADPEREADGQAGRQPPPATTSHRCSTSRNRCRRPPPRPIAAGTPSASRRRRRSRGRSLQAAAPYALIAPVLVVIAVDPRLPALLARRALDRSATGCSS